LLAVFYLLAIYTLINAILPVAFGVYSSNKAITLSVLTDASGFGMSSSVLSPFFDNNKTNSRQKEID